VFLVNTMVLSVVRGVPWPLDDIAITNIGGFTAYKKGSVRGRILPNGRAIVLQ